MGVEFCGEPWEDVVRAELVCTSCHPEHQIWGWGGRQTDRQADLLDFCQLGTLSQCLAQPGHILQTHSAVPETEANKALRS